MRGSIVTPKKSSMGPLAMGWWSIGDDEVTGDGPVGITTAAFERLVQLRTEAQKPAMRWEDLALLLAVTVGRSSRELAPRKDAKFVSLKVVFEGSTLDQLVEGAKPVAEELAILRDWAKNVSNEYKELSVDRARRRPSARELLAAAAHVIKADPAKIIAEDDTRKLDSFVPNYEHEKGQVSADELVAIIAASLRRNERRLGLMVENGATMAPEEVIAITADGREIKASVASAQAVREQVDDMCERFETAIAEHRDEKPESYLAKLAPSDRERLQRNSDQRGLPTLEGLIEQTRQRLARVPERWAPLKSVRVETSERSGIGLPSRPPPVKFVDSRLRVRHPKFGEGFVERTFEDGEKKYEVVFANGKRVTLMARFLEPIGGDAPAAAAPATPAAEPAAPPAEPDAAEPPAPEKSDA